MTQGARDAELFGGGPPVQLARRLGLSFARTPRLARSAALGASIGWLPLALLAAAQGSMLDAPGLGSLLKDFALHARSLAAVPLLILADAVCAPRLSAITYHFLDAGLVPEHHRPRFEAAVDSTKHWLHSTIVNITLLALTYALCFGLLLSLPASGYPAWHLKGPESGTAGSIVGSYSMAGWWHALVSLPLLLVLLFGWLWRVWLWARLLWLVARMELRLVASHPDLCAGLKFVGYSVRAFSIVGLAMGIVVAGRAANNVLYFGISPSAQSYTILIATCAIAAPFLAPLLVFTPKLVSEWRSGIVEYGALADRLGRLFEKKWFEQDRSAQERGLESSDFSSLSDLYQITANVYAMRLVPVDLGSIVLLVGIVLLPFVPVVLLSLPLDAILRALARLFL